jgi:N-acetylmuramoyl-L-alanine amidase
MKTICVDPGHGGPDPGAVGGGLEEEDLTLAVGLRTRDRLVKAGYKVVMTRETDKRVTNPTRCKISNDAKADVHLAIHFNAARNPAAKGTEVIYAPRSVKGKRLAQAIQDSLVKIKGFSSRGILTDMDTGRGPFSVIRKTNAPSVIVEVEFVTNAERRKLIDEENEWEVIASHIVEGIENYFKGGKR